MTRRTLARLGAVLTAAAIGALALLGLAAAPASAHTQLVSSTPANGASLATAPSTVTLTFDEEPKSVTAVRAQATEGPLIALGAPVLDGRTVTVTWPADAPPGLYRLGWQLVSDDGDPVEGFLLFSYAGSATASPAAAAAATTGTGTSTTQVAWYAGVALLVVAAGVLAFVVARRRRDGGEVADPATQVSSRNGADSTSGGDAADQPLVTAALDED